MGQKPKARRRPWLAGAVIKALIAILAPAAGLIAPYLRDKLDPYRLWVWVAFFALPILAVVYEFISARTSREPSPTDGAG
ncbi:MAG: hypothetical protein NTU88_11285 [Armatimonadetes bacterium]|nr:hypothetical protein [Armatimonadota bacterium]